jgi:hypothetical protein
MVMVRRQSEPSIKRTLEGLFVSLDFQMQKNPAKSGPCAAPLRGPNGSRHCRQAANAQL